jgi:hypothetical protein
MGHSFRYDKELLWHSCRKITEIYTRLSVKSIQQIKSMFGDLKGYFIIFEKSKTYIYQTYTSEIVLLGLILLDI